jgi:hypothetical protein
MSGISTVAMLVSVLPGDAFATDRPPQPAAVLLLGTSADGSYSQQ